MSQHSSRKKFLQKITAGIAGAALIPDILKANPGLYSEKGLQLKKYFSPNDTIQIGLIGAGGMGTADANTAITIPGVKLIAACDLYDGRLADAKKIMAMIFILPGITGNYCSEKILMP